jgi:hypothetical protein
MHQEAPLITVPRVSPPCEAAPRPPSRAVATLTGDVDVVAAG